MCPFIEITLHKIQSIKMETKIILPKALCEEEAIKFVARRYGTTVEKVLKRYLVQAGIIKRQIVESDNDYELTPNELELFRDLGVQPSTVEIY